MVSPPQETGDHFYALLSANKKSLGDWLENEGAFQDVPRNWHVIITDIVGSTQAYLAEGMKKST